MVLIKIKPVSKGQCYEIPPIWIHKSSAVHRDRHRMVVDGGAGGGLCSLDVVCLGSEKNSGGEWWWSLQTVWKYVTSLMYVLVNGWDVNFILSVFHHNLKKFLIKWPVSILGWTVEWLWRQLWIRSYQKCLQNGLIVDSKPKPNY